MTSLPSPELFSGSASLLSYQSRWQPGQAARQDLLRRFGNQSSSYFNLQDGVERFGARGVGFIAYRPVRCLGTTYNFVFANPVCEPGMRRWLLNSFLETVPGRHLFLGIDEKVAMELQSLGMRLNEFGTEFSVPLEDFSVAGKSKKQLRHAYNLDKREPIEVREQTWDQVDADEVREISEGWRQHKTVSSRELRLLTRPPVFGDEWGVRKFYAYKNGKMLGYVFFDPFFEDGKVVGYTANILRQNMDEAPTGLLDHIILNAIDRFREEGIRELSLGISPLHDVQAMPGDRKMIRWICQFLYEHGNSFYAFKALSYHKTRYRGNARKWYIATDSSSSLNIALSALKGTQLLPAW